jgi:hypothetical protein
VSSRARNGFPFFDGMEQIPSHGKNNIPGSITTQRGLEKSFQYVSEVCTPV